MIRYALILSLLVTSLAFAGGDDFVETDDSIKLSDSIQWSRAPLSDELIQTIAQKVDEKKDTLKKCDLWTIREYDIYPILKALEKCTQLKEIRAHNVTRKTALALSTIKIIADGPVSSGLFLDIHPRSTMALNYDGYNLGIMCEIAYEKIARFLGLENPFDMHTKEYADKTVANSDALEEFLKECRTKKFFLLSDPNFEAILDAQK